MVSKRTETGRNDLLNTTSLNNRKGRMINFESLVVSMVGRIMGVGGERTQGRGTGRWLYSERAPEKRDCRRAPVFSTVRSWAASRMGNRKFRRRRRNQREWRQEMDNRCVIRKISQQGVTDSRMRLYRQQQGREKERKGTGITAVLFVKGNAWVAQHGIQ